MVTKDDGKANVFRVSANRLYYFDTKAAADHSQRQQNLVYQCRSIPSYICLSAAATLLLPLHHCCEGTSHPFLDSTMNHSISPTCTWRPSRSPSNCPSICTWQCRILLDGTPVPHFDTPFYNLALFAGLMPQEIDISKKRDEEVYRWRQWYERI